MNGYLLEDQGKCDEGESTSFSPDATQFLGRYRLGVLND